MSALTAPGSATGSFATPSRCDPPDEAEAILALADEVAAGVELAADEAVFRADWRIHYAAERVVERVFQAARDLSEELQERYYFGGDAFRALRGMRNRLAQLPRRRRHPVESVSDDLPADRQRLASDTLEARALIDRLLAEQVGDPGDWDRDHLGAVAPPDPE